MLEDAQLYDGLEDLESSELINDEDYCDEIEVEKWHYHPEAYEEEDWS
jgi:hypothetical protein